MKQQTREEIYDIYVAWMMGAPVEFILTEYPKNRWGKYPDYHSIKRKDLKAYHLYLDAHGIPSSHKLVYRLK